MRPIHEQDNVVEARRQREYAEDKLADAKADEERKRQKLEDAERAGAEGIAQGRAPSGLKKAREELAQAEQERRVAQEAVRLAHEKEDEAIQYARSNMRRAVNGEYTKKLRALNAALDEAQKANDDLRRVQAEAIDILGQREAPERAHWPELVQDHDHDSRLKSWRRYFGLDATDERAGRNGKNGTHEPVANGETEETRIW